MTYDPDRPVVTVTATVIDGTVVRWHGSVQEAANHRPAISASRRGVAVHATYLTDIPVAWQRDADAAYRLLVAHPHADMTHLATHRHRGPLNGPLEEVPRG